MDWTAANIAKLIIMIILIILLIFFLYTYLGPESGSASSVETIWKGIIPS